jgi:hypothetical protein
MEDGEEHYEDMEEGEIAPVREVIYHCDGELHKGIIFLMEDGETEMIVFELHG